MNESPSCHYKFCPNAYRVLMKFLASSYKHIAGSMEKCLIHLIYNSDLVTF